MTQEQARIVVAMADNGLVVDKAARAVPCHRNTIMYHARKIMDETGLDIRKFYDITALLDRARAVLSEMEGDQNESNG